MNWQPKPYQQRAVEFGLEHKAFQLWLAKGLGKTSITLHLTEEYFDRCEVGRVLVISTLRITTGVWPQEITKWDLDIPIRDIEGGQKAQARILETPWWGIETLTFGKLKWLASWIRSRCLRKGKPLPWQLIIFDESSKMKAAGTQRFRAMRHIQPHFPERVINLTGSPAPQGMHGVWGPAFMLDGGERLGRTFEAFDDRWFQTNPWTRKKEARPGAADHIHERLQDVTLAMKAEDYLTLPPLVINDVRADLPPPLWELNRQLERELFLQLEQGTVEIANPGVLTGKCRQLANGALYLNGETDEWEDLHEVKLELIDEVVEEAEGEPVIVAYQFKFDLVRLRKRYPYAAVLADDKGGRIVDEWNAGKHQMLLLHPASAGHGLNLQDGGAHMAFLGCPWSFDMYDQCLDRIAGGLRRQRPTYIHRLTLRGTVDEDIIVSLETNRSLQEVLMDRMTQRGAA